jgi:hypothetical protein
MDSLGMDELASGSSLPAFRQQLGLSRLPLSAVALPRTPLRQAQN